MMKKLIIGNCMKSIKNYYPNYDNDQLERIQYGLESIYLSLTKLLAILLLAILLNIIKETIIVLLLFNLLRMTGFGLHATKSWACWVTSIPTFIGIPLLCKYLTIPKEILIALAILSVICFILFAPADTIKRPLIRKRRRIIYKILTISIGITYLIFIIMVNNPFWQNALMFSMIIETVLICPLTYKLFKLPYNNYKNYKG